MNFRGLGTSYRPALLCLTTLFLLGALALVPHVSMPQLAVSGENQTDLGQLAAPGLASDRRNLQLAMAQLPLRFEPNQGQADPQVKFVARGAGYGLFLTPDQAVLALHSSRSKTSFVRMQLAGIDKGAAVTAADKLPGKSNYFIGNDPARWHHDIPQFSRVRYQGVYPGVDLVYYGNQGELEYDFEVAPGANPGKIALRFPGHGRPQLDKSGDLLIAAGDGQVRLKAPRIYQPSAAGSGQQAVTGRFAVRRDGEVGFELGAYDRSRVLVIDPLLTYSTYLGGVGEEACSVISPVVVANVTSPPSGCPAVALDASSNIYIAGSTNSATGIPLVPTPPLQTALAGTANVFVTKLNSAGTAVLFSTYLGGDTVDITAGVAADSAFNVVVAGTTTSSNFPTTGSAFQTGRSGPGAHAFVSVLSAAGTSLVYSTYLSGNGTESARGLALDNKNKIYLIGATTSTNAPDATHSFPATLGAIQTASLGTSQFFVSKLDPTLLGFTSLVYSTYFGGGNPINGVTLGGGIAVDVNANVYITGGTNFLHTGSAATDFPILNAYQGCLDTPPPPGTTTTATNCSTSVTAIDAFVAKLSLTASSGAQLLYSTYLGGSGDDVGYGIAVDSGLSAYVTGATSSADFIIPTGTVPLQQFNGGAPTTFDAFLGKLGNPCTGSSCTTTTVPLNYFSYLGGTGNDAGLGIAVNTLQGARIAGWTKSPDFPNPNHPVQAGFGGVIDGFAARIDTTATSTVSPGHYVTYLGGGAADFGTSVAVDLQGNSYIAGETASTDFPLSTATPFQPNLSGTTDAFLSKLGPILGLAVNETVSPNPVGVGNNVTFSYTITNGGDLTTGIIFTDILQSTGATVVSAASSPGQTNCANTSGTVTCSVGTLNAGAIATVTVVLAPTVAGSLSDGGRVTVFGTTLLETPNPPAVATVNDFTVAVSPATATVTAGVPASYTVTVNPTGNIPETVTLSVAGAPSGGSTTFPNGASFTNLSSGSQSRQLVVNTTARVTTPASLFPANRPFYAALLPVSGLALLGAGIGGKRSRRRRALMAALLGCFFALVLFQAGCGSSSSTSMTTGTPAGTYNLTVTATSGTATRTQQIVLVVQ